jgi:uroporphyrinogen-III decarboxylase
LGQSSDYVYAARPLDYTLDLLNPKAVADYLVKAYEVLGDRVALRGNLSPSLLTTGTPEEVDAAVRHLVDNIWNKGGCMMLDGAFGIPDETPVDNVRAMFNAARKYAG